ncbi:MAG TPA: transcriptional regulator GcvA [Azospirillaceae bacterium]|nr:transcriptional regulator GcvA [Azospirillaceae bacterium]
MGRLPSIQTLQAFEAAGRHQSYSRAAEELGVTHGAISHRIRELEARLGTRLFRRSANAMLLTPAGQELLFSVRHGLGLLERAFQSAPRKVGSQGLRVSVLPAFAALWLVPRLHALRAAHPGLELELHSSVGLADLGEVDAAVRYGEGGWPGLAITKLTDEWLFPVCSPAYRDRLGLAEPADLVRATLLHTSWHPWDLWLREAGLTIPAGGPSYPDSLLLLHAAAAGEGVALGRGILVRDEIRSGRLVRPFALSVRDRSAYYVVHRPDSPRLEAISAFREWLAEQILHTAPA